MCAEHKKKWHACDECDKTFATKCTLNNHLSEEHKKTCHACEECDKTLDTKCNLKEHISAEHKRTCYACDGCGETFGTKCTPKEHLSAEHMKTAQKQPEAASAWRRSLSSGTTRWTRSTWTLQARLPFPARCHQQNSGGGVNQNENKPFHVTLVIDDSEHLHAHKGSNTKS